MTKCSKAQKHVRYRGTCMTEIRALPSTNFINMIRSENGKMYSKMKYVQRHVRYRCTSKEIRAFISLNILIMLISQNVLQSVVRAETRQIPRYVKSRDTCLISTNFVNMLRKEYNKLCSKAQYRQKQVRYHGTCIHIHQFHEHVKK